MLIRPKITLWCIHTRSSRNRLRLPLDWSTRTIQDRNFILWNIWSEMGKRWKYGSAGFVSNLSTYRILHWLFSLVPHFIVRKNSKTWANPRIWKFDLEDFKNSHVRRFETQFDYLKIKFQRSKIWEIKISRKLKATNIWKIKRNWTILRTWSLIED